MQNNELYIFDILAYEHCFNLFSLCLEKSYVWNFVIDLLQIYTENWVNSPGQQEDNSWQAFVYVPKDDWYIAQAGSKPFFLLHICILFAIASI